MKSMVAFIICGEHDINNIRNGKNFMILLAIAFFLFVEGPRVPEDYPPPSPKGLNGPSQATLSSNESTCALRDLISANSNAYMS